MPGHTKSGRSRDSSNSDWTLPDPFYGDATDEAIIRLYVAGTTYRAMSAAVGLSKGSVARRIRTMKKLGYV